MKQGQADRSGMGGTKVEPKSTAVPPAYTAQIGLQQGDHVTDGDSPPYKTVQMDAGQGLKAPMASETCHVAGSQGKHR